MDTAIAKAVMLFRSSPDMDDEQIHRALVDAGIDWKLAARLVELVPMVYCRVLLADSGARFPETFQRFRDDDTTTPPRPLTSEPVWVAAMDFAKREIERGLGRDDKLSVAGRSAEFRAANELLNKGSKLGDLGFTPSVFMWSEEGPGSDPPVPRKPWWRIWR
jgi:hypothetical protein